MHRKKIILLKVLLLTQTMPAMAMITPEEFDFTPTGAMNLLPHRFKMIEYIEANQNTPYAQGKFQPLPQGQIVTCPLLSPQHVRYEARLFEGLDLNPLKPPPQHLGQAWERLSYAFTYEGSNYNVAVLCPKPFSLQGNWNIIENRRPQDSKIPRDEYILGLSIDIPQAAPVMNQPVMNQTTTGLVIPPRIPRVPRHFTKLVHQDKPYIKYIDHEKVNTDVSVFGRCIFNGQTVYQEKRTNIQWKGSQGNSQPYYMPLIEENNVPNGHQNNTIIYVEAFPLDGNLPRPSYVGKYDYLCPLGAGEIKTYNSLIYNNGSNVYLPTITQERWHHDDGHDIGFFIASFNANSRLKLIPNYCIFASEGERFGEGLYSRTPGFIGSNPSVEKWTRLGDSHEVKIYLANPISSIPGFLPSPAPLRLQNQISCDAIQSTDSTRFVVSVKGINITTNDLIQALSSYPNLNEMNVCGLNTITLNQNLTSHGLICRMIAPTITIGSPITINLSGVCGRNGRDGEPGFNGAPGGSGGNGGQFLMAAYYLKPAELSQLVLNTKGGEGGRGGNGGVVTPGVGFPLLPIPGIQGPAGSRGIVIIHDLRQCLNLKDAIEEGAPAVSVGRRRFTWGFPTEMESFRDQYKLYYFGEAKNPQIASYISVFPNL